MNIFYSLINVFFISLFLIFLSGCNKENDDGSGWNACYSCTLESWVGEYSGSTQYFDAQSNSTVEGLEISIEFEETATDYLTAYIIVPNYYSATISGEFNSPYSISFAGSSSSVSGTLSIMENELRFMGNSKKFHYKADSLVIDEVINFEVYKQVK